jgi:hypothetical protein
LCSAVRLAATEEVASAAAVRTGPETGPSSSHTKPRAASWYRRGLGLLVALRGEVFVIPLSCYDGRRESLRGTGFGSNDHEWQRLRRTEESTHGA